MRVALGCALTLTLAGCTAGHDPTVGVPGASDARPAITGAPALAAGEVRVIASGLRIPWGLAFLPDGSALVTERGNHVAVKAGDRGGLDTSGVPRILRVTPEGAVTEVQRLSEVDTRLGEGGLLGLAVSPTYATDGWVYVYYSAADDNRVARLRLGERPQPILTGLPVAGGVEGRFHQGGRVAFGPDGMLYVSVGDAWENGRIAQDPASLGGKILRVTPDGRPAPGNPFPGSPVWSYGHRNVQGLAWDEQGRMYASELGADTYDELNRVEAGGNYGWPRVEGFSANGEYADPIATWTPTARASPSGIAVRAGHLYVACLRGQALYRLDLDGRDPRVVLTGYGRLRTVAVAPDGALWVTTSNQDQVGQADGLAGGPDGDRILRLAIYDRYTR